MSIREMPYREKEAWLYLIAMVVAIGPYFAWVAFGDHAAAPLPDFRQLLMYGVAATAQMLIIGAGHLYLRLAYADDARAPADERDHEIGRRSMSIAYYILITGLITVGGFMPFYTGGWEMVNTAIGAIVLAEFLRNSLIVRSYREHA